MTDANGNTLDLFTINDLRRFPVPEWLLTDHMHKGDIAVIYGAPGSGKSFLAIDWALSIAAGVPWLGYAVAQGPILYMAGEGAPSIYKRVNAWMISHDVPDVPMAYFHLRPLPLREDEVIQEIQDALDAYQDEWEVEHGPLTYPDNDGNAIVDEPGLHPALIIVDTLSQFFSGGDEVSPDMTQFVNNMRRLAQEAGVAILIVHHTNATDKRERGHSSLRGNVEVMFKVEAIEADGQIIGLTLINDKQKDDPRVLPLKVSLELVKDSLVVAQASADLLAIQPRAKNGSGPPVPMRKRDMLAVLAASDGYKWLEWRLASGVPKDIFNRRLRKLIADGEIYKDGDTYFAYPAGKDIVDEDD